MIHIATIHWRDDCWVDLQLDALKKHSSESYRTYAFLNHFSGDSIEKHTGKFDYVSCENIQKHSIKLNLLADIISFASDNPEDLLVFLDGDAFPIADYAAFARKHLSERKLIAVKREENNGDQQPHPSFCITTVGFWREIKGSWEQGYRWKNCEGKLVSDVGGYLLGILNNHNINWLELLRSNHKNLHPIFFGIYGEIVYHHGAGFRPNTSLFDRLKAEKKVKSYCLSKIFNFLPASRFTDKLRDRFHPSNKTVKIKDEEARVLSAEVFDSLQNDSEWYRHLMPK
jgi:hypothetical protein